MAYSSTSRIGDTARHSGKREGGNDGKVSPSTASHVERESERRTDQFMASDSFYHRMEGMIKKGDVEAILKQQRKTLANFEKTNAKFGKFNDLSAARFLNLNNQLKGHTKMLLDMKKDLDSIFRRIRTLKTKLTKQYGSAFEAVSAGIQKLEEELGASIENEDASSVHTLTESQEFKSDNQPLNQEQASGEKNIHQSAEEGTCQGGISQSMSYKLLGEESIIDQCTDDKSVRNSILPVESINAEAKSSQENCPGLKDKTVDTERTVTETPYSQSGLFGRALSTQEFKERNVRGTVDLPDLTGAKDTVDFKVKGNKDTGAISKSLNLSSRTETPDISDTDKTVDTSRVTKKEIQES